LDCVVGRGGRGRIDPMQITEPHYLGIARDVYKQVFAQVTLAVGHS